MQAERFDQWRSDYDDMTAEDHAAFYSELHSDHPDQRHFDYGALRSFLDTIPGEIDVIELGGYDGELAGRCLLDHPRIRQWDNYDLDPHGDLSVARYQAHKLSHQLWDVFDLLDCDLFVASHTIEHLSKDHLLKLLVCVSSSPYIYLDTPLLADRERSWNGGTCAHKLELAWSDLEKIVCDFGYTPVVLSETARGFKGLP